jgi:hypothetical protein
MAEMQRHDLTRVVLMVLFIGALIAARPSGSCGRSSRRRSGR